MLAIETMGYCPNVILRNTVKRTNWLKRGAGRRKDGMECIGIM
jgi:hypothetical protein